MGDDKKPDTPLADIISEIDDAECIKVLDIPGRNKHTHTLDRLIKLSLHEKVVDGVKKRIVISRAIKNPTHDEHGVLCGDTRINLVKTCCDNISAACLERPEVSAYYVDGKLANIVIMRTCDNHVTMLTYTANDIFYESVTEHRSECEYAIFLTKRDGTINYTMYDKTSYKSESVKVKSDDDINKLIASLKICTFSIPDSKPDSL